MLMIAVGGWMSMVLCAAQAYIWVEGETPTQSEVVRHPWYDQVKTGLFSGGDFLSHFNRERVGHASYAFNVSKGGKRSFWIRLNPVQAAMSFKLNDGDWQHLNIEQSIQSDNVAADGKPDLRFIA